MPPPRKSSKTSGPAPRAYVHPESTSPSRPEIGAQAHFKKTKTPATYRYDSSLAPELVWDEGNPAREQAEHLIAHLADCGLKLAALALQAPCKERDGEIQRLENAIREAKRALATLSGPFLNWTGKVQMCYIDPPYGVKFGSNFQPFIRKREVKHNEDDDFTREPEMVQAY